MKPNSPSLPLVALCATLSGCNSTETGNPTTPDDPVGDSPFASNDLTINVGLRSASPTTGPSIVGAPSESGMITGLWLHLSELELLSCAGDSTISENLSTPSSYSAEQSVSVAVPGEEICGIAIRTMPLTAEADPSLPSEGAGQGAVIQRTDNQGLVHTAVIPGRVFSFLAPVAGSLRLDELSDLSLQINDTALLSAFPAEDLGVSGANGGSFYDQTSSPQVVTLLETQLETAFSLVAGDSAESVAAPSTELLESTDLLCRSDCSLVDRSSCLSDSCVFDACLTNATGECGPLFSELLACRLALSPSDIICGPDDSYSTGEFCDTEEARWAECARSF